MIPVHWTVCPISVNNALKQIIPVLPYQLSHFKIPRYIEFVEEFPTTVTGKIQKFVMRYFFRPSVIFIVMI